MRFDVLTRISLFSMHPPTIADLTTEIRAFCEARDWGQFHGPKEMAVALAAEGSLEACFSAAFLARCACVFWYA